MKDSHFSALAAGIAFVQGALILAGLAPPLFPESATGALFSLARMAIVFWQGWTLAGSGFRHAAAKGALTALSAIAVICAFALIGRQAGTPVLGISASFPVGLLLVSASVALANGALGALVAGAGAWLAPRLAKNRKG